MSFRIPHTAGYGSMAEERRQGAVWLHGEKEKIGNSISALLDHPSMPIPTGIPFVPELFVAPKSNAPATGGLRFTPIENPADKLARSIALGSELVNIARTTNFLEAFNGIIEANNALYSDPGIQARGKEFNYDVDIGHIALRGGRMPCWQESDKEALIHGRMDDLSRMGKIAQVIYAMPLAAIIEAVRRKQRERNAKIHTHKKSGNKMLIGSTDSIKSMEIEKILDLPVDVYFTLDGTIIDMAWGGTMSEFLKTRKLQSETRFRVALAAEG